MRPIIAKLLERNGKTFLLPIPPRLNDLKEYVRVLGVRDEADEEGVRFLEYRSLIGVAPATGDRFCEWDDTTVHLSMLTPGQLDAVRLMCASFDLAFENLRHFFDFIGLAKGITRDEMKKSGVPAALKSGEGAE